MEVATQAKSDGAMTRERHENRDGMRRGEHEGVHKPIEIAPMLLSGLGGMSHTTMPMPLSSEVGRGGVPIPTEEPRDAPEASQELLELGVQVRPDFIRMWVCAERGAHGNYVKTLGTGPWDNGMSTSIQSGPPMDCKGRRIKTAVPPLRPWSPLVIAGSQRPCQPA